MRSLLVLPCLFAFTVAAAAQPPAVKPRPVVHPVQASIPPVIRDLPVRKVVLYKNGVGYFEHSGSVTGSQRVSIDFTSSQLNDVLQSLTVLDEGGGRISGINWNSTTPLAEQLKSLSLGLSDDPSSTELFQSLRGQRVQVTGAPGGAIDGRLVSIESRTEKKGDSDSAPTVDHYYLTVVANSGAVHVVELTPALSVRPTDPSLQLQLDRYLELLASTHATGLRHLTLNATGQGERKLRVSYISEVPIWKSTYRIVFPREPNGKATLQGWAVVDNTIGADWDNVQLALVAGSPQSFIQPLSQPLYTRRQEVPIAIDAQLTPQTHEAAEEHVVHVQSEMMNNQLIAPTRVPRAMARKAAAETVEVEAEGNSSGGVMGSATSNSVDVTASTTPEATREGDVTTASFDDFFEYALSQPVSIHKNESAMVPILQQDLPIEHVTLWSASEPRPLRAVWLENSSSLTLDKGSFSIYESGEFAGEGLLDTIHPGEKRLLSYAADQALRVRVTAQDTQHQLRHVKIEKGVIVETYVDLASTTYTAVNSADGQRSLLLEHARHPGDWSLDGDLKPAETAPTLYRFRLPVPAHSTQKFEVREKGPQSITVDLNSNARPQGYLLNLARFVPEAETQLKPAIDAAGVVNEIERKIDEQKKEENAAAADEARCRENLTALKGNDAAKRFVDQLNRAEDRLESVRKTTADLEQQKIAATEKLNATVSALSLDWDVSQKK
jgi:hypothetical protein